MFKRGKISSKMALVIYIEFGANSISTDSLLLYPGKNFQRQRLFGLWKIPGPNVETKIS